MRLATPQFVQRSARLAVLTLLVAGLAGCQSIAGIQPVSQVRVIDVSPDAPALDIYQNSPQNSSAVLYNVGFGTVSSYIPVPAGVNTHAAYVAGTQQQLATAHGNYAIGSQYTVLTGNISADLQMTVLRDQSFPAPAGQVALRFLDQATRGGTVDIYLVPPGTTLSRVSPIDTGLSFSSNTGYINAPSGTYSIVVLPAGAVPSSAALPIYTGGQVNYPGGSARTILLIDQQPVTAPGLQVITAGDYDSASS
ncbi:MAG: DUF4397 domain-containing protein [Acidobacteriaceae bacterium]